MPNIGEIYKFKSTGSLVKIISISYTGIIGLESLREAGFLYAVVESTFNKFYSPASQNIQYKTQEESKCLKWGIG